MTYAEKLKHPKWQKKRLEILERDQFKCQYCKDEETTLHVHHNKYKGNPWDVDNSHLQTLCSHCHKIIESIKKDGDTNVIIERVKSTSSKNKILVAVYDSVEGNGKAADVFEIDGERITGVMAITEKQINFIKSLMDR